ncbi:alpha/beta fold hydrolase [Solirubrobacter deserti]|uniref:Alpha/beta hydrolase n=1 Tax=Solirubrobacter deserti TaxID=2282478 RepID=A0ABT4RU27_9ACTN|nr:alpha/beta hydrolase [Solirubrobacter deserti]MDA0141992.1 alpha/beta hydrolase [Solirubrobacter deserti]
MESADGVELAVRVEGSGPPLLLLHGFPDRADLWRHQIEDLKSDFTVIAPDLRGFGDSDKPDDVRVGKSVGDMVSLLDQLGFAKAHVVGHDWGAGVAWAFAFSAAERLDRFAVLSVGHPGVPPTLAQREKGWYRDFFLHAEAEEIVRRDDWKLLREWAGTHPEPDRVLADLERPGALTAALNWYRCNHRPRNELNPPRFTVNAPTLGVWSSGDAYLLEDQMTGSADFVPDFRYERIDGAGHWMQLDAPDRVTALLRSHLC